MICIQCLPALVELVQHSDLEVKIDACWALSFLADGNSKQIQVGTCYGYCICVFIAFLTESCGI